MDYTIYSSWYNYMNNMLRQINGMTGNYNQIYGQGNRISGANGTKFSEIFQGAAADLDVPESMDAIFDLAAQAYDVPVALLKAVGKAESGFNANAVSSAGAQGVMQLMPATARSLGVTDPFDARSNIMGGAKYISDMLRRYDGDIELALAAYNAGSGNVAKYGGVPPFTETQNYIKKVKEYMGMDLAAGAVASQQPADTAYDTMTGSGSLAFDSEDALYFIEMMRLNMQNRIAVASQSLFSEEGTGSFF